MAAIELAQHIKTYTFARLYAIVTVLMGSDIADITLELSEREIYNDIRSNTTETAGFEESYGTKEVQQDYCVYPAVVAVGVSEDITVYVESGDTEITWIGISWQSAVGETILDLTEAECDALGGRWRDATPTLCMFGDMTEYLSVEPIGQTGMSFTFRVTNTHATLALRYTVKVAYRYLAVRTMKVRSTNETSIAKYGRRVMNLTWALGMTRNIVQQMIDNYLAAYSEPVPILSITMQGKTDRLASFILSAKINDIIRITHAGLGMNHDFWINQVAPTHRADGILECDFELEQVRAIEQLTLAEWDESTWDEDVWAA